MKSSYPTAIKAVLAHEGGYTNHPADPGGPTNWGITIHDARMYWLPNATAADVKAMPLSVAQEIYKKRYWDAQKCDLLPAGLDYSVFDYGVNSGIGRSGKVLRRILGLSDATSVVTQEVLDAVAKRDTKALIVAMNEERLRFLKALRTWPTFGAGWGRRVAEVRAMSIQLASGRIVAAATPTPGTETMAKGDVPKPAPAPVKDAAKDAGKQGFFAMIFASIAAAMIWLVGHPGIAIGATVVLVGGGVFAWRWWKGRQSASADPLRDEKAPPAAPWLPPARKRKSAAKPAPKARRSPRKPAAKPKGKKKPARRRAA